MPVLLAVLDDLFRFALRSIFGLVLLPDRQRIMERLPAPLQPLLPLLPKAPVHAALPAEIADVHGSYFVSSENLSVRTDPVVVFDNVIARLPYGAAITVLKYGGRWAMVQTPELSGWVLKDEICSAAADVLPQFASGSAYDADAQTTKRVRLYIGDSFSCREPGMPLSGAEYVTYRLARRQRIINWPTTRPRLPGQWQSILRGRPGIHMSVFPKASSIMEVVSEDEGYILYVEAVFPDDSIQVSAVDYDGLGVYSENIFGKEVWQGLKPVFIEVL